MIKLVEEAEAHRAGVQRIADTFSAYYLPVVATIAALTFVIRRNPLATAAVLVVACSCSFALATPIAMLASIGAGAKRGLLIKGGKYLEILARADVLLVDKTGTLTLGRPQVTDVIALNGMPANVGIAMGAAGTDIAIEAAHIALMRDDWMLVPAVIRIARRTMRVVKMNIERVLTKHYAAVKNFLDSRIVFYAVRWLTQRFAALCVSRCPAARRVRRR